MPPDDDSLANAPTLDVPGDGAPREPSPWPDAWLKAKVRSSLFGTPVEAQSIGRFRVLRRIGAGGMGVVMLGYDEKLDRKVAIKLIATPGPDETGKARMLREARAMARITHPNVARVYEVGEFQEQLFVAMEYIGGPTLGRWLDERERTVAEILEVFVHAGRGLAAAHAAGIVHRDFKPANVLIDESGRPLVLDFGLARSLHVEAVHPGDVDGAAQTHPASPIEPPDPRLTMTGSLLGTPAYMAPEQIGSGTVDARADQYSFCLALFEALWRRPPLRGLPIEARLDDSTFEALLHKAQSDIPDWLIAVLRRGLRVEPSERFESMDALLEELSRDQDAVRRRRWRWAMAGMIGAVVVGALGVSLRLASTVADKDEQAERARSRALALAAQAEASKAQAEDASRAALRESLGRKIAHANLLSTVPGGGPKAVNLAMEVIAQAGAERAPDSAIEALRNGLMGAQLVARLDGAQGPADRAAFSPDGRWLVTSDGVAGMSVRLLDATTTDFREQLTRDPLFSSTDTILGSIIGFRFTPDASRMVAGGTGIKVWRTETGELERQWEAYDDRLFDVRETRVGGTMALALSASGERLVAGSIDGKVTVLSLEGELRSEFDLATWVEFVSFVDEDTVLAADRDGNVRTWNVVKQRPTWRIDSRDHVVETQYPRYAHAPGSDWIAISRGSRVFTWKFGAREHDLDVETGEHVAQLAVTPGADDIIALGAANVRIVNAHDGSVAAMLPAPQRSRFTRMSVGTSGRQLATVSREGLIQNWDIASRSTLATVRADAGTANDVLELSSDGARLIAGSNEGFLLWDMRDGKSTQVLQGVGFEPRSLQPSPDRSKIAVVGRRGRVVIVPLSQGEVVEFPSFPERVEKVLWVSKKRLVTEGENGGIRLWSDDAMLVDVVSERGYRAMLLRDPDGLAFVEASADWTSSEAKLVDGSTGDELETRRRATFAGLWEPQPIEVDRPSLPMTTVSHTDVGLHMLQASNLSQRLLLAREAAVLVTAVGQRLKTWTWPNGEQLGDLGTLEVLDDFAVSPDGRHVAIRKPTRITVHTVQPAGVLAEFSDADLRGVSEFGFLPGGARIYSAREDGVLHLWDYGSGEDLELVGHRSPIEQVLFALDGKLAVTRSADGEIRVWNAVTGESLGLVRQHATAMALLGDELILGQSDGSLGVHPLSRDALIHMVCELERQTSALELGESCAILEP